MKINNKLKQDLNTYKLNFPTDRRTKEYNAQIERFKAPELYKLYLQSKVELAKLKQKETNKQEKKQATKKARADNKKPNRYIGSIYLHLKVLKKVDKYEDVVYLRNLLGIFKLLNEDRTDQEIENIKSILQNTEFDIANNGDIGKIQFRKNTELIDVNVYNKVLGKTLNDIVKKIIDEILLESPVIAVDIITRNDNIQIVNDKIKPLDKIRMKDAGAGIYDGYAEQEWDTNTGRCVFDYIIYRYKNINGFKKICNYESLCKIFNNCEDDDDDDDEVITDDAVITDDTELLNIGVNTNEIKRFCSRFNIPMYAVDEVENTFNQYTPQNRNKNCPAMIYRISNKHFYPIIDKEKILSIVKITSMINNISSDIITASGYKANAKKQGKKDEAQETDNNNNIVMVNGIYKTLLETLDKGIIPEKIKLNDKNLVSFNIGKNKYISNKDEKVIKDLCNNMNIKYIGQGMGTMLIEIMKEALKIEKLPKSCPNPYVYKSLLTARKARARIGIIDDEYFNNTYRIAWDINKCYSSCMNKPSEDWIKLDFNDTWDDYDGELKLGLYYLKTDDTTLFKKSGYYSTAIIKKAITENIHFEITKQLLPSYNESKDIFTKIIDVVLKYSNGDTDISKPIINIMSGMLGQSSSTISKNIRINNDIEQIFNFLNNYYDFAEGIMINKIENTDYYMYGFNKEINFTETNIPMYIQVVDESNIKLYDMVKEMGGKLVAYKVDCAVVSYNHKTIKYRRDKEWGGYSSCCIPTITRKEIIDNVEFINDKEWDDNKFASVSLNDRERWEDKQQLIDKNGGLLLDYIDDWDDNKHYRLNDSDRWEGIFKLLNKNKGLLLQASAGNGKTYTAQMIASKLGDRVRIIAPTNKAGLNIGGGTIHRFLELDKNGYINQSLIKLIQTQYDYIIVDEISMIDKDLWRRLCLLKQELPHLIFLLLGDNKQLSPVEQHTIKDYFNHPAVKYICNYNKNILNVRKRYDEILYNLLEDVDNIDITKYPKLITDRNICYYNKTRIRINKMWNEEHRKDGDLFLPKPDARIRRDGNINEDDEKYFKLAQDMYIYENMPIIAMRTLYDKGKGGLLFANSETFNICHIGDGEIGIYNERPDAKGEKEPYSISIPIEDFNKYFLMNYCSTTHKTQGETITENFTIYDWKAMDTKLRYTALSRAKKIEQVYINH